MTDATEEESLADDLVRYFETLPAAARREFDALAETDRRFGEDVVAERGSEAPR